MTKTKMTCPRCLGNGYIKLMKSVDDPTEIIEQCPLCSSEGEINMDKKNKVFTERLVLESLLVKQLNKVIEKLNKEVDMLTEQKVYLQSKLKEKENRNDEEKQNALQSFKL